MKKLTTILFSIFLSLVSWQCQSGDKAPASNEISHSKSTAQHYAPLPHSFANPNEAVTEHLSLNLNVDFNSKTLRGYARWTIQNNNANKIIFDTDGLTIEKVTTGKKEKETPFKLAATDPLLGTALKVAIKPDTKIVTIYYTTSPDAAALGWLSPEQTFGKKYPFMYTQGHAILTRSWIPCQDSPSIRITYDAKITTPTTVRAVMSATNPEDKTANGEYYFSMEQSIPVYLVALAVGDLVFEPLTTTIDLFVEPGLMRPALGEYDEITKIFQAAEQLYGRYLWQDFGFLVMPPAFPYGGMENPRLVFISSSTITGDRSMVSLLAHELAHSWSGNLVTNATWDDFWLNEGFADYTERRIMEKVRGKDFSDMMWRLGYEELKRTVENFGADNPATQLKLNMKGKNPDDAVNSIAYEKGALFLKWLEEKVGRTQFDNFLKAYYKHFAFKSITTEDFVAFLEKELITKNSLQIDVTEWIYGKGIPADLPSLKSEKLDYIDIIVPKILKDKKPMDYVKPRDFSMEEWVYFIHLLPKDMPVRDMKRLDIFYHLGDSKNAAVASAFLELAIYNGYAEEIPEKVASFLMGTSRSVYLIPVYKAFLPRLQLQKAAYYYEKAKPNYHFLTRKRIEKILYK